MWSETTVKKTDQADTPKETKSGKFQTSTIQIFSLILRAFFPSELTVPQCPKNFESFLDCLPFLEHLVDLNLQQLISLI